MTAPLLSRPVSVRHVGQAGLDATVEAEPSERDALARDLGLAGIARLVGRFRLEGTPEAVRVTGRVEAEVVQTCVVTLDEFPARIDERVDLSFREPSDAEAWEDVPGAEFEADLNAPDALVGGAVDLGAVTAEFLALALDPYPRKPGATLDPAAGEDVASPFAALAGLRRET